MLNWIVIGIGDIATRRAAVVDQPLAARRGDLLVVVAAEDANRRIGQVAILERVVQFAGGIEGQRTGESLLRMCPHSL